MNYDGGEDSTNATNNYGVLVFIIGSIVAVVAAAIYMLVMEL